MSEWKIGDRVRLVGSSWDIIALKPPGFVVAVEEITPDGAPKWENWFLNLGGSWVTERVDDPVSVTVKRSDIALTERAGVFVGDYTPYRWDAWLFGSLSTGEDIDMTRYGSTYKEALAALEEAIAENGWVIE